MKKILSLLLVLVLIASLAVTAYAADASVTFLGRKSGFEFNPGSLYTSTDLFKDFKGVMPGDSIKDTITVRNKAKDCDYIKLYIRAMPHGAIFNPMSPNVAAANENVYEMRKFLEQMELEVYYNGNHLYTASLGRLDEATNSMFLGKIRSGKSGKLTVQLNVPIEMGNEFEHKVGEVDWLFTAECYNDPPLIQTGQLNWPIPLLFGTGLAMILFGIYLMYKQRKDTYA